MTPSKVRSITIGVCVCCVAGMIVSAILKEVGAVISLGLLSASAISSLMVAFAVSGGGAPVASGKQADSSQDEGRRDEGQRSAEALEVRVSDLVSEGVDERRLREMIGLAVKVGRSLQEPGSNAPTPK